MFKIAICDDESIMLDYLYDKILCLLDKKVDSYEICKFDSGEAMLESIISNGIHFDAIFLDIEMERMSGLEVAEAMFSILDTLSIIFVTNRDDLVFDAINFRPFSFIRKSKLNDELERVINRLIKKYENEQIFCEFRTNQKIIKIKPKDIIYIESQGHYIFIRCVDHDYKIRGKLFDYEAKMSEFSFIRIHIAYIVNIRHVCFVKYQGVRLDNNIVLPISRKKYGETKNKYLEYVRKYVYGNN